MSEKPRPQLDEDERREQLLRAGDSVPADAAPRIELSEGTGGATRIDIAETAAVRPGDPDDDRSSE
jgi:hypothetical protein